MILKKEKQSQSQSWDFFCERLTPRGAVTHTVKPLSQGFPHPHTET